VKALGLTLLPDPKETEPDFNITGFLIMPPPSADTALLVFFNGSLFKLVVGYDSDTLFKKLFLAPKLRCAG
jgi:hypothetical protein